MIYLVRVGAYVKVGYSADPWERFKSYREPFTRLGRVPPDLSGEAVMLAVVEGDLGTERLFHRLLAPHQAVGEWFHLLGLLDVIDDLMPGLRPPGPRPEPAARFQDGALLIRPEDL